MDLVVAQAIGIEGDAAVIGREHGLAIAGGGFDDGGHAALLIVAGPAIGAGTISWVLLLSPIATAADSSLEQKIVAMAYPVLDLILLGVVVRLVVGAGRRPPSLYLLVFAAIAVFITDGVYGFISVQGIVYDHSGQLELGWGAFYLLWGAAALHGSMTEVTTRAPDSDRPLSGGRLAALAAATLVTEIVHAVRDAADGTITEPLLYVASIGMFVLVLIRLAGMIQRERRTATREKTLREAGASLVSARDRDGVYRATLAAARRLAGPASSVAVLGASDDPAIFDLVVAEGDLAVSLEGMSEVSAAVRAEMLLNGSVIAPLAEALSGPDLAPSRGTDTVATPPAEGFALLLPLAVRADLRGLLAVALPQRPDAAVVASFAALAIQAALALESAESSEIQADLRSQAWFASLVQNASDVILVIEADTSIRFVSPACHRVLGYQPEELMGRRLADLIHPDELAPFIARLDVIVGGRERDPEAMGFRMLHADGHWMDIETLPSNLLADPNVKGVVLNARDVSERKLFEAQLAHQAFYDSLTGLANRALFQNRVEHAMARRRRRGVVPSVLFMDLDDFKTINDSLGHLAGDRLLTSVARRLQDCLRDSDTAARLGGDEFGLLVEDAAPGPSELAIRVLTALADPFDVDGKLVHVRGSIGIASGVRGQVGPEAVASLLRNADVAMYSAKGSGGGTWHVFEPAMLDAARLRLELKSALALAVERDELILHYQPIVELETGTVRGVEALVRWVHPERGLIAPLDFIPLAEETGQIVPIGNWVLNEACRAAVQLQQDHAGNPRLFMTVNLSGLQLQRPEIVTEVAEALAASGLAPGDLHLEITESVLMHDVDATIERLQRLKALGVSLAIDDFGTGYSSLNYLRRFPVDFVKIDKSFVDGIADDPDRRSLVTMIVDLTVALSLRVVAEGIERPDQRLALRALGCEFGQGYLFARPVPLGDVGVLLDGTLGSVTAA